MLQRKDYRHGVYYAGPERSKDPKTCVFTYLKHKTLNSSYIIIIIHSIIDGVHCECDHMYCVVEKGTRQIFRLLL